MAAPGGNWTTVSFVLLLVAVVVVSLGANSVGRRWRAQIADDNLEWVGPDEGRRDWRGDCSRDKWFPDGDQLATDLERASGGYEA